MKPTRSELNHRGFRFSYLDSAPGDVQRPAVLLLHGFPDEAQMWRTQIDALHAAGYRCIAPDTLGCGESDMAPRVRDYHVQRIITDHAALLDHLGIDQAHVVGHDWGAIIAWFFAAYRPQRTQRLVVMSVGHPTAYAHSGLRQKLAGWYVLYFQLAGLCERLLIGKGRQSLHRVFASHPNMQEVQARLRQPGRLTAALRIYRANLAHVLLRRHPKVKAATLGLWSKDDRFLVESQMMASRKYVDGAWRYQRLSGGHWIGLEQPETLTRLLLDHLEQSVSATNVSATRAQQA